MDAPMLAREGSYEGESLSNVETVHVGMTFRRNFVTGA